MLKNTSTNKKNLGFLFLLLLFLVPEVRHVLADYLGPDRRVVTSTTETFDVGVWAKPDPTGNSCNHFHGTDCIVCTWERKPGKKCGDATYAIRHILMDNMGALWSVAF